MDDSRPRDAADARQLPCAMMKQRIDQRPVEIACGRVHHEACGLVDDQQMLVFEHDRQRDVLRLVVRRRGFRNRKAQCLLAAHLRCRVADRLAFGFDGAAADQALQPLARQGRDGGGERTVEAPARMSGLQAHIDRLNSPHSQ